MSFLYVLERIRTPFLDGLFYAVTQMGDELFFIAVALLVFWCVDKRCGYYLLTTCFFGILLNEILKLMFRIPRPWVRDPAFTVVEKARARALGYSFPSGHTQNAVCFFGCIALWMRRRWVSVLCGIGAVLVAFSRLYLGVHTPWDVGVSAALALLLVCVLYPVFHRYGDDGRVFGGFIAVMTVCSVGYLFVTSCVIGGGNRELSENIVSGISHGYYMLGGVLGLAVSYPLERKYVRFDTHATPLGQAVKMIVGMGLVIVLKGLLKQPLLLLFGGHEAANALRYGLTVLFAGTVWPMSFRYLAKLRLCRGGKEKFHE